jgi:anti-sigma-K factor RskA
MSRMSCEQIDELAGAYALGAVDADEDRSVSEHLASCDQPHAEVRDLIGAGTALTAGVLDVDPSPGLRDRLMATVAETPQEHQPQAVAAATPVAPDTEPRRPRWRMQPVAMGIAAVILLLVIGLGAWGLNLNAQLAER